MHSPIPISTITCPPYGHREAETMPVDSRQPFCECKSCHAVLTPLAGDCRVYCSCAGIPCPPMQGAKSCC